MIIEVLIPIVSSVLIVGGGLAIMKKKSSEEERAKENNIDTFSLPPIHPSQMHGGDWRLYENNFADNTTTKTLKEKIKEIGKF